MVSTGCLGCESCGREWRNKNKERVIKMMKVRSVVNRNKVMGNGRWGVLESTFKDLEGQPCFQVSQFCYGHLLTVIKGMLCHIFQWFLSLVRKGASRLNEVLSRPESGAATAEYAVVLIAATAFAGLLLALLKSDTVRSLLTSLVKQALSVG